VARRHRSAHHAVLHGPRRSLTRATRRFRAAGRAAPGCRRCR
jgi:DTW domain-containing protein YfiP